MNRHLLGCFLFTLLCGTGLLPCAAQQFFNKRYTLSSGGNVFTGVLQKNNKYFTVSLCNDSINYVGGGYFKNLTGIKFSSFDTAGNLLHAQLYQREDKRYTYYGNTNNLIEFGTDFLFSFSVVDTTTDVHNPAYKSTHAALVIFDSLGEVLIYKEYERPYCAITDETNHILMDFKPDAYGNWLMLSSLVCSGQVVFCLRKLDSGFNEIWVKNFSSNAYHNVPKHLLIEDDGYVMSGGVNNGNFTSFPDYYTSVLIKCDTAGNKLWDWHNMMDTNGHIQYIINDIIRSKDGGYIYCGSGEGRPSYFDGSKDWSDIKVKGWVEKLDASRNSVWKKALGVTKTSADYVQTVLKELENGDIMVAGVVSDPFDKFDSTLSWVKGSLAKLNSVDGTIIWQHYYKSPDKNDTMVLKVNDMRQTTDGGFILAGEATNAIDRKVGPVQRGWLIKVDSNGCEGPGDPQCWPAGIPEAELANTGFNIYPNPSNGSLTLTSLQGTNVIARQASLATAGQAISAKVYDLLGRTIYQSKLRFNGQQASIRLNAPNGIYILEISTADGNICREKIEIRN